MNIQEAITTLRKSDYKKEGNRINIIYFYKHFLYDSVLKVKGRPDSKIEKGYEVTYIT